MMAMWRRVWFALLSYIFASAVLSFVFNAMEQGLSDVGTVYRLTVPQLVVFGVSFVIFVAILCGWYMSFRQVRYEQMEGFKFGLMLMITTLVLDISALMVYGVPEDGNVLMLRHIGLFVLQPLVIIRLSALLSVPIVCGYANKLIKKMWYNTYRRTQRRH